MFPVIALSHSLQIHTWGVLVFLAALSVLWLGSANASARNLPSSIIERSWPWLLTGGLLGAHFYYLLVVEKWPLHPLPIKDLANIFSGTAVQGGILGGIGVAVIYLRRERRSFLSFCDVLSPAGALAQAITRVGCFAAGCCYGRPTKLFLGVVFSNPLADPGTPRGIPLHPAQLYEAFLDLCLAIFLQRKLKESKVEGVPFAFYLMGSSLIRFIIQFFRDDDNGHLLLGLAHSQFLAIALFVVGAAAYNKISGDAYHAVGAIP